MKKHLLLLIFLFVNMEIFAQFSEDEYRKQAEEIRKEVWNSKMPFFDQRTVPEGHEKYSKVILSRRQELSCVGNSKTKYSFLYGVKKQSDLTNNYLFREVVKINDEVSLKSYSEISFQKFSRYSKNKKTSFIGFRILKPNGTIKEINPDEIILTDDDKNYKEAKLAVSDLQIGDIVDYFMKTVSFYSGADRILYNEFEFAEEDPVLHYSVHIELNNNLYVEYRSMNGAPEFKVSSNANNDIILDAEQNNIKQYPINLWVSKYRQIPLIRINIRTGSASGSQDNVIKTTGSNNAPPGKIVNYWKSVLDSYRPFAKKALNSNRDKIKKLAESYLQNNGGGTVKDNSLGYYYAARHFFFLQPDKKNVAVNDLSGNYSSIESTVFLSILQLLFDENKFDAQVIMLPSRFGPRAGEAMYATDFGLALLTNDKHIYTARSVFDCPDQLPYYLEGQQPTSLFKQMDFGGLPDKNGYNLKTSSAENNVHEENLIISFNADEPQKIKVNRKTVLSGQAKSITQKKLVIDEDYYEEERKVMGISESFMEELSGTNKGKKIESEYKSAFNEIREQWKDDVKDEVESQFNVIAVELSGCSIEQAGIFNNKPDFIYNTQFIVNDWVKTAGNNYILEAGKMVTPTLKLTPEQRERHIDIYMPYARKFQFNVEIPVPAGFSVEGVDKLNTNVENTTGSFITTASLDSGKIILRVTQTFKHAFEKAEKWQELLVILDAATSFENAKILLKKL